MLYIQGNYLRHILFHAKIIYKRVRDNEVRLYLITISDYPIVVFKFSYTDKNTRSFHLYILDIAVQILSIIMFWDHYLYVTVVCWDYNIFYRSLQLLLELIFTMSLLVILSDHWWKSRYIYKDKVPIRENIAKNQQPNKKQKLKQNKREKNKNYPDGHNNISERSDSA